MALELRAQLFFAVSRALEPANASAFTEVHLGRAGEVVPSVLES